MPGITEIRWILVLLFSVWAGLQEIQKISKILRNGTAPMAAGLFAPITGGGENRIMILTGKTTIREFTFGMSKTYFPR